MAYNHVRIDTAFSSCTGIILSCEEPKQYIILTNRHLISCSFEFERIIIDLAESKNGGIETLVKYFKFILLSKNGLINQESIELKSVFISKDYCISSDIMAFLVEISDKEFTVDNYVYNSNGNKVFLEGFPGILSGEIFSTIKLEGKLHDVSENHEYIGRYAITDDYHHYEHLQDLKVFAGLSGSPLKISINKREFIIGMNVSLPNQPRGTNAFKLLYYIKINHILEFLRANGILIYDITDGGKVRIKWIYRLSGGDEKTILVFGGSGAGKTSFIKSFALNGHLIDGSGDGQTTRSNIYYEFHRYEGFKAEVRFLERVDFVERRINDIRLDLIDFLFQNCICKDMRKLSIFNDYQVYMKAVYKDIENRKTGNGNFDDEKDILEYIETELRRIFSYSFDTNESALDIADMVEKSYAALFEKQGFGRIFPMPEQDDEICIKFLRALLCKRGLFDIYEFKFILERKGADFQNEEMLELKDKSLIILELIFFYLNGCPKAGLSKEGMDYLWEILKTVKNGSHKKLEEFYGGLCDVLQIYLLEYIDENELVDGSTARNSYVYSLIFDYDIAYNKAHADILLKCLKVHAGDSLSSLVERVSITDSISSTYAYMLHSMGLNKIKFIDTKGLDHVEQGTIKEEIIQRTIQGEKEEKEDEYGAVQRTDGVDAVLYLKKLDSGRPTELERIVPSLFKIAPQLPIYVGFTGIDLFDGNKNNWDYEWSLNNKNSERKPKAVAYIQSDDGAKAIKEQIDATDTVKDNIYNVLSENVFPFYGKLERSDEFSVINRNSIQKLIKSILLEEYNIITYIPPMNLGENIIFKTYATKRIKLFFKEAERIAKQYNHPQTQKAIFTRIIDSSLNHFGFEGTYRSRIDMIFADAYNNIFSRGIILDATDEKMLDEDGGSWAKSVEYKSKMESLLRVAKNSFIGASKALYIIDKPNERSGEQCFRTLLVEVYKDAARYNPYDIMQAFVLSALDRCDFNFDNAYEYIENRIRKFQWQIGFLIEQGVDSGKSAVDWINNLHSALTGTFRKYTHKWEEDVQKEYPMFFGDDWKRGVSLKWYREECRVFMSMVSVFEYASQEKFDTLFLKVKNQKGDASNLFEPKVFGFFYILKEQNYRDRDFIKNYFEEVFSFERLAERRLNGFIELFLMHLDKAISQDSTNLIGNLLKTDEGFKTALESVQNVYNKLLGMKETNLNEFFASILKEKYSERVVNKS